MSNCTSDEDCRSTLVCYISPQWSSMKNFCGCESWYGWVGAECLDLGSGSVLLFICALTITFFAIITFVLTLDQLKRTVGKHPRRSLKRGLRTKESVFTTYCFNTAVVTLGLISVSLFGLICWQMNFMVIITSPQENTLTTPSNGDEFKLPQRIVADRLFIGITVLFNGCALLEVSLVWLEIAEASLSGDIILRTQKYRRVINAFQAFWVLLYIICVSTGQMALLASLTMPVFICVMVTFLIARYLMFTTIAPLLELTEGEDSLFGKMIETVEFTTRKLLIICLVVVFFGGISVILTLSQYYRDLVSPDAFVNAAALFSEVAPWGSLATSMVLLRNLYETLAEDALVNHVKEWTRKASEQGILALQKLQAQTSKVAKKGSSYTFSNGSSVTFSSDGEPVI